MKRRAIFFDIDGTLLDERSRIPASVFSALREMKAAGQRILICSGRSRSYIFDERLMSVGFDGIVSGAGTMVEIGETVRYSRIAPPEKLIKAVETARKYHYGPMLEGNRAMYMERKDFLPSPYIDKLYRELGPRLKSLDESYGRWPDVPKLSMIASGAPCPERVIDELKEDWSFIVHIPEILELTPHGADKGTGLMKALDALGIPPEDSVAFGDGANDLPMFRDAGIGIAMGNASEALKAQADYVTTPLNEDGIWNAWQWLKEQP